MSRPDSLCTAPRYNQIQLELHEAPEGIAIQSVSPGRQGLAIQLIADADRVPVGLQGNLIVEAFTERNVNNNRRRIHVGFLPAIAFETVPARLGGQQEDGRKTSEPCPKETPIFLPQFFCQLSTNSQLPTSNNLLLLLPSVPRLCHPC